MQKKTKTDFIDDRGTADLTILHSSYPEGLTAWMKQKI